MCGIAGIFDPDGSCSDEARITTMGRTMVHRGPDNTSVLVADGIALSHNRLSIIDLSASGNQPFRNDRYSLIFNGEIYNYLDLKKELSTFPIQYRSSSDTEVLFHYLTHHGVDRTLAALRGMFAFAYFDHLTSTLVLARDRFGIKPLYWHRKGRALYFSSEIKAIAAVTPLRLNPIQTLFSLTGGAETMLGSSMFEGVTPVRPGTSLTIQPGRDPVETTYYSLPDQFDRSYAEELRRLDRSEVNRRFSALLEKSVTSMLMSDAPMGIFVSGGIDSSLVAAVALKHQPLTLFTSDVQGAYSELKDAQLLAESLQTPLHVSSFDPHAFLRNLAEATYHNECPVVSFTNAVAFMDVAGLARKNGVKAVLTGEGSDELFHGYPQLLTKRLDFLLAMPLNVIKSLYRLSPKLAQYVKLSADVGQPEFLRALSRNFHFESGKQEFGERSGITDPGQRDGYFATIGMCDSHLLGLLHRNDRMGMRSSIESRFPFLDEDLVKFAINLPAESKYRKTWRPYNYKHPFMVDKAPVRDAAEHLLPASLVRKKKWGFAVHAHQVLRVMPGFFSDGFVGDLCGLTRRGEQHLLARTPQYYVGKLVSIEAFGRLFGPASHSIEQVSAAVAQFVSTDVPRSPAVAVPDRSRSTVPTSERSIG